MNNDKKLNWVQVVKDSYNKIAREFSFSRHYVWADTQVFLDYIKNGDKVLDLGCGNGRLVDMLLSKEIEYFGVDQSEELIKNARKNYSELQFDVMEATKLDYKDEEFDAIFSVSVLNHIPPVKHKDFFNEVFRVLKPGGYFMMANWNMWSDDNPKGLSKFQKKMSEMNDEDFQDKYGIKKNEVGPKDVLTVWGEEYLVLYYYAFEKEELEKLGVDAGFEVVKSYYSKKDLESVKEKGNNVVSVFVKSHV